MEEQKHMTQNEIIDAFKDNAILLGEDGHFYRVTAITRTTYDCTSVDGTRIVRNGSFKMLRRLYNLDGPITADIDYTYPSDRFAPVIYLGNLVYVPIPPTERSDVLYIATDADGDIFAYDQPPEPDEYLNEFDTRVEKNIHLVGSIRLGDYTFSWKDTLRRYKVVNFANARRLLQPSPAHKYFTMDENGEIHAFIEEPVFDRIRGYWNPRFLEGNQRLATVMVDAVDPETLIINHKEYIYYVTD